MNSLECGGLAPLSPILAYKKHRLKRRQAAALQKITLPVPGVERRPRNPPQTGAHIDQAIPQLDEGRVS